LEENVKINYSSSIVHMWKLKLYKVKCFAQEHSRIIDKNYLLKSQRLVAKPHPQECRNISI
jgi:hypothetical protein